MGRPEMHASAIVPGPAFVTIMSEEKEGKKEKKKNYAIVPGLAFVTMMSEKK